MVHSSKDSAFQLFQQEQQELLEQVGHALTDLTESPSSSNIQRLRRYVRLLHQGAVQMEVSAIAQRTTKFLKLLQPHITGPGADLLPEQLQHFTRLFQQLQAIPLKSPDSQGMEARSNAQIETRLFEHASSETFSTSEVPTFVAEDNLSPDIRQFLLEHDIEDVIAQLQDNIHRLSEPEIRAESTAQLDALLGWGDILDWPELVLLTKSILDGIQSHPEAIASILTVGVLGLRAQRQHAIDHLGSQAIDQVQHESSQQIARDPHVFRFVTEQKFIWQSGKMIFAIDLTAIAETIMPKPQDCRLHNGSSFIQWNEHLLPLININQLLTGEPPHPPTQKIQDFLGPVLIIPQPETTIALEIEPEQFIRNADFTVTPQPNSPDYHLGTTSIGTQTQINVIDTLTLIRSHLPSLSTITAPQAIPPKSEPAPAIPRTPTGLNKTATVPNILVVDDSRIVRYLLQQMLEKSGYRVILANDGLDALKKLDQNPQISLMMSDVEMPHLTGFELLSRCRRNEQWQSLPIIILSQCPTDQHDQLSRQFGADGYLPKPFDQSMIITLIESLLSHHTS